MSGCHPEHCSSATDLMASRPYAASTARPYFNLSHSGHIVALALCWDAELGIDIELMRPIKEDVAAFFGPRAASSGRAE
jgi:phosphopantetheinyl transferase